MTLAKFNRLIKKISPTLKVRQRGIGDIVGLFSRTGYICRLTKGELTVAGYRYQVVNPENPMQMISGNIQKRGRKTVINLLKNYRWVKNHRQKSMLTWGIEK